MIKVNLKRIEEHEEVPSLLALLPIYLYTLCHESTPLGALQLALDPVCSFRPYNYVYISTSSRGHSAWRVWTCLECHLPNYHTTVVWHDCTVATCLTDLTARVKSKRSSSACKVRTIQVGVMERTVPAVWDCQCWSTTDWTVLKSNTQTTSPSLKQGQVCGFQVETNNAPRIQVEEALQEIPSKNSSNTGSCCRTFSIYRYHRERTPRMQIWRKNNSLIARSGHLRDSPTQNSWMQVANTLQGITTTKWIPWNWM